MSDGRQTASGPPLDTVLRQRTASDPKTSAWVSANAGSGKTHVLTQRVVRLLLDGVPPTRILCLTFTKAAAANMSIRVFRTLAHWTTLDDAALRDAIAATGAPTPSEIDLTLARKLFARTVETPGGLKIQTIHAFCERLLHLFPFEANVPARFEVLDDARKADLLLRAREAGLAEALRDESLPLAKALALLAQNLATATFATLIGEALAYREILRAVPPPERLAADLARLAGIGPTETPEAIERAMIADGLPRSDWSEVARRIGADGGGPGKTGNRLRTAADAPENRCVEAYIDVFLTAKREPRADSYLPAALRKTEPALCDMLDGERARILSLVERRKAARMVERTAALLIIASTILGHYDTAKRRRGLLDFEDLIERTRTLLNRSDAAWVLYKLDSGIDHILVDEAQDTSPEQWDILRSISADFFAGAGRSEALRTFFAVGDDKQSIYSFQGARPDMFASMNKHFATGARGAKRGFADVRLLLSFRSARAILAAVDRVFAHSPNATGLTADGETPPPHEALRRMPGLVEIWPLIHPTPSEEPVDWRLPVDVVDPSEPPVVLARRIADGIARWTAPGSGETVEDDGARRPLRAGDVMILVRSRGPVFEAMIRALKERRVPVAGADRLALTEHIAVMDLIAAGRTALDPGDDFTLACVLKSPLVGFDDDDLIRLAPSRTGSLIAALRASDVERDKAAARKLRVWQSRAETITPFAFYTQILSADRGRHDLLARLGPESADAIDEFIALALAHERDGAPSLLAFLARLEGAELSVKRDMEAAGDAVRVMTVHAAKGLEAKVVILPDTCGAPTGRHDPKLFRIEEPPSEDGGLLWSPKADADAGPVGAARAQARQRAIEEYHRLLYVAMTRAEERLYIAGFCGAKGPAAGCWYEMITAAELDLEAAPAFWNAEDVVRRFQDAPTDTASSHSAPLPAATSLPLPAWLTAAAPAEAEDAEPPIRPSNPLGAADQLAPVAWSFRDRHPSSRRAALATGRLMHKLLQYLPDVDPHRRREAATRFLGAQGGALGATERETLIDQAFAVIDDPRLAPLFGPLSRAEVAVAATVTLSPGQRIEVAGQIDRIGVTPEAVHIADYKTGRLADTVLPRHLVQLALYRAAVAPLYPDLPVRCHLVWTAEPRAVEIDPAALDEALVMLGTLRQ